MKAVELTNQKYFEVQKCLLSVQETIMSINNFSDEYIFLWAQSTDQSLNDLEQMTSARLVLDPYIR